MRIANCVSRAPLPVLDTKAKFRRGTPLLVVLRRITNGLAHALPLHDGKRVAQALHESTFPNRLPAIPPLPFRRGEGRAFAGPKRLRPRRRGEGKLYIRITNRFRIS